MAVVLTTVGKAWVADVLNADVEPTGEYIGWGTGAGTAAAGDTDLFTPAAETRVLATRSNPSANVIQWVATLTSASAQTITNAGVFSAITGGTLIVHVDHSDRIRVVGDQITYTLGVTF